MPYDVLNLSSRDTLVNYNDVRKIKVAELEKLYPIHITQVPHREFDKIMSLVGRLKYLTDRQRRILFRRTRDTLVLRSL